MANIIFTERAISKIPAPDPSGKQRLFWSEDLRGFGVLVSGKTNAKSYVVQRNLPGKRTRRVTIGPTNAIGLDEASARAKEILATFYRGIDPKAGVRGEATLRTALEDYVRFRPDLRPRTVEEYRDKVRRHLDVWLDLPLRHVTREMVEDRLHKIAADVAKGSRHNGHSAANGAMRTFRLLYNHAAERAPPTNPMPPCPVKLRKQWLEVQPRTRHLSDAELPKFYEAVCSLPNPVARDFILLLLFTGFRRREAAGLRWEAIDFDERVIRLAAEETKGKRKLNLPMSDYVFDLLAARREYGDARWVFPAPSRSGHIEEPRHPLDLVRDKTGVIVSAHDLRRTFVTAAEATEMSSYALKALVNHSLGKD